MKTNEQLTADVLSRRDAYLEKQAARRKKAARYTLSALCVCAAVFAAAGLFRSGLLDDAPPVSLGPVTASSPSFDSSGNTVLPEDGTGTQETTVPRAVNATEETSAIDLSGKPGYVFPSATEPASVKPTEGPGTVPTRAAEPETAAHRQVPETTARQDAVSTEAATKRQSVPATETTTKQKEPVTEPPSTTRPEPTKNTGPHAEPPTEAPSEEPPACSEQAPMAEIYVLYRGGVYAAKDGSPRPVPAGAYTLETKDALVYDGTAITDADLADVIRRPDGVAGDLPPENPAPDSEPASAMPDEAEHTTEPPTVLAPGSGEGERTRITLLSLPSSSDSAQIGITAEGFGDDMYVLEYVCPEEDFKN